MTLWNCKTSFSIGESILSAKELVTFAAAAGYKTIALADTMSVTAIIDASNQGKKVGIQVIAGAELRVQLEDASTLVNVVVYARNTEGFVAIMGALSDAVPEPKKRTRIIPWGVYINLLACGGVVEVTADSGGIYSEALSDAQRGAYHAATLATGCARVAALVAAPGPGFARQNAIALDTIGGCIVSQGARYLSADHNLARDLVQAISKNQKLSDRWANHMPKGRHLRSTVDVEAALKESFDLAEKLGLTVAAWEDPSVSDDLTDDLKYRWAKMDVCLPKMAPDEFAELVRLCKEGWRNRLETTVLGYAPAPSLIPTYHERLKYELGVLRQLNFSGYFLLVADIVTWSKSQGIMVGPGRGSVGGSLIAYLLGITDVDPVRFGLIFERFINPDRIDLPDADLDFQSERRHEVFEYIRNKWGDEYVANISNYNTLAATSALGETGRAYQLPEADYRCASFIPKEHGQSLSLEDAMPMMPDLQDFAVKHPAEWDVARLIEGKLRSMGTHAAGVVIASVPLKTRAVVEDRGESRAVTWDKRVVEDMGLVKIDILGLANLDILFRAVGKIKDAYGKDINLLDTRLDDPKTMEAFGRGDTVGIFQFESGGMRKLLKDLASAATLTFEELSAATALFRPGPLDSGLLDDYVALRKGHTSEYYEHPNMEAALKETRGVIVYQEQVMQICRDLSGFTMPESDGVRKAIGKKDKDKMQSYGAKFVDGAVTHSGMDRDLAQNLWDRIELFGGYGFNKSHSVEYAIISVWTMWLKVHYPHEFYAACLEIFKEDRLLPITQDAAKRGITILPPDVNESQAGFVRSGDNLLAPLSRIKGLSEISQGAILETRTAEGGAFRDKAHLEGTVMRRKCNVRHIELMERVGAFASITPGSNPVSHPDRIKDQLELLPGLILSNVRADRAIVVDPFIRNELAKVLIAQKAELNAHTMPRMGSKPKFMVLFDAPSWKDEQNLRLMDSGGDEAVKIALKSAGFSLNDAYFTCLSKTAKQGGELSKQQIAESKNFLDREIELLKPPVILCLGSASFRSMLPAQKGGVIELAGTVVYVKELDASVVIGISPGMIFHDASKQSVLNDSFQRVAELLS